MSSDSSNMLDQLVDLIDQHLAEQLAQSGAGLQTLHMDLAPSRRSSLGTMFVDWDGSGAPVVTYRNQRPQLEYDEVEETPAYAPPTFPPPTRPLPTMPTTSEQGKRHDSQFKIPRKPVGSVRGGDTRIPPPHAQRPDSGYSTQHTHGQLCETFTRTNHPTHGPRYVVEGFDRATRFQYDYDGEIMHVHRARSLNTPEVILPPPPSPTSASTVSDYYALDARKYDPRVPLRLVDKDKELPKETRKRDKMVRFIEGVLRRWDAKGLLRRFREGRNRDSTGSAGAQVRAVQPPHMPYSPGGWI